MYWHMGIASNQKIMEVSRVGGRLKVRALAEIVGNHSDMLLVLNRVPIIQPDDTQQFDFLILATKNIPDSGMSLVDIIWPAVTQRTTILLLQNGFDT